MKKFSVIFLVSALAICAYAQVIIPFAYWNANSGALAISPSPLYIQAATAFTFTASGGTGAYTWSNTAGADGATILAVPPNTADYLSRASVYATDTVTLTSGATNITATVATYSPLVISPTTLSIAINSAQSFTATGGCLNGTNCVGGTRVFSMASGTGTIVPGTGAYVSGSSAGTDVVQVADSIGNVAQATVTVSSTLTISPPTLKLPVFSTNVFSSILGTQPYTYSIFAGTGTIAPIPMTSTALYTAPSAIGTATVRVTDFGANTSDSAVTIIEPVELAGGQYFMCARYNQGSVKCWGYGGSGQLGIGSTATIGDSATANAEVGGANLFVNLGTGRTATKIVAGLTHVCAMLDNSTMKCWGGNSAGQLGLGDVANRGDGANEMGDFLPAINLGTGKTPTSIYAFGYTSCAILNDATLKCWGKNNAGQLGKGDVASRGDGPGEMGDSLAVINLGTGKTATQVSGGLDFACAILNDGSVKCWGQNKNGQLGKDNATDLGSSANQMGDNLTAININGTSGSTRTALEIASGYEHTCIRRDNNTIICWGRNNVGHCGVGSTVGNNTDIGDQTGEMAALAGVTMGAGFGTPAALFIYGRSSCAMDTANVVKCWGRNQEAQLEIGSSGNNQSAPPAAVVNYGTGLVLSKLSASFYTPCAIFTNKRIKCWGRGTDGGGLSIGIFLNGNTTANLGDAASTGDTLPFVNH